MSELSREEKLDILEKALEARKCGDNEEAARWSKKIPLAPHLAMVAKDIMGKDFLIKNEYNLSAAEEAYGRNWLN